MSGGIFKGSGRIISPASIKKEFVKSSGSDNLLVNGSSTPVVFELSSGAKDATIEYIEFVLVANSIQLGQERFGGRNDALSNGIKVEVISGGITGVVYNIKTNDDLVHFASPSKLDFVIANRDMIRSCFVIDRKIALQKNSSDILRVTVRDNLSSNTADYLKCGVCIIEEEL